MGLLSLLKVPFEKAVTLAVSDVETFCLGLL